VPYLSALEVRSRRGAIQIHVYLYLYLYQEKDQQPTATGMCRQHVLVIMTEQLVFDSRLSITIITVNLLGRHSTAPYKQHRTDKK